MAVIYPTIYPTLQSYLRKFAIKAVIVTCYCFVCAFISFFVATNLAAQPAAWIYGVNNSNQVIARDLISGAEFNAGTFPVPDVWTLTRDTNSGRTFGLTRDGKLLSVDLSTNPPGVSVLQQLPVIPPATAFMALTFALVGGVPYLYVFDGGPALRPVYRILVPTNASPPYSVTYLGSSGSSRFVVGAAYDLGLGIMYAMDAQGAQLGTVSAANGSFAPLMSNVTVDPYPLGLTQATSGATAGTIYSNFANPLVFGVYYLATCSSLSARCTAISATGMSRGLGFFTFPPAGYPIPTHTPTMTATPTRTSTSTPSATTTSTPTITLTATNTATPTISPTPTITTTPTTLPTLPATPTATRTPSPPIAVTVQLTVVATPGGVLPGECVQGALPGSASVSPLGSARYSVPIVVPPGSAGMAPELSIEYDSSRGESELGMGFYLTGLSEISRCPRLPAYDGVRGTINYDQDDRFCLDGKRLVLVSGSYSSGNAEFRTEPDSFSKIESFGATGVSGPARWLVLTKDGKILEYGGVPGDSGNIMAQSLGIRTWALRKLGDRTGKFMTYTYQQDSGRGEYWVSRIDYTGHTSGRSPYNRIEFTYGERPLSYPEYTGAGRVQRTKLLQNIRSITKDEWTGAEKVVADYAFGYRQSNATRRMQLVAVTQCAPTEGCLPATTFEWQDWPSASISADSQVQWGSGFGGKTEVVLRSYQDQLSFHLGFSSIRTSTVGGWHQTGLSFHFPPQLGVSYQASFARQRLSLSQAKMGDFNGDGRTDVVQITPQGSLNVWLSSGAQFVAQGNWGSGIGGSGGPLEVKVADVTGDGLDDLIWFPDWPARPAIVAVSTGVRFESAQWWRTDVGPADEVLLADFNGDAKADIVSLPPWPYRPAQVSLSTGVNFSGPVDWATGVPSIDEIKVGDFNGDGRADLFSANALENIVRVRLSTGSSFLPQIWLSVPPSEYILPFLGGNPIMLGDLNGDGSTDLLNLRSYSNGPQRWLMLHAYLSTSRGFVAWDNPIAVDYFPNFLLEQGFFLRLGDFNGDGRADLLRLSHDENGVSGVRFSQGDKFRNEMRWVSYTGLEEDVALADSDGDGRDDLLRFPEVAGVNPGWVAGTRGTEFPDLLKSIRTGIGAVDSFTYRPLTDSSMYLGRTAISPPDAASHHLTRPRYFVSRHSQPNGLGNGQYHRDYTYRGAKWHESHGFLGFREVIETDRQLQTSRISTYHQDFPRVGRLELEEIRTLSGTMLFSERQVWSRVQSDITPNAYSVRLDSRVQNLFELNGVLIRPYQESFEYDDYQNVTNYIQRWGDVNQFARRQTVTDYTNNASVWLIGLPHRTTITDYPFGAASANRITSRTFYRGTGLLETESESWQTSTSGIQTRSTSLIYDNYGNVRSRTLTGSNVSAGPRTETYDYSTFGRSMRSRTTPLGFTEAFQYGSEWGGLLRYVDVEGRVVSRFYDGFGREREERRPDGTSTVWGYCTTNNPGPAPVNSVFSVSENSTGLPIRTRYFDVLGRELRERTTGFGSSQNLVDTRYDSNLRLERRSDIYREVLSGPSPLIPWTIYNYDTFSRPTLIRYPYGAVETITYSSSGALQPNALLSRSFITRAVNVVNDEGKSRRYLINGADQLVQVAHTGQNGQEVSSNLVTYQHQAFDRVSAVADKAGTITRMTYDQAGRRETLSDPHRGTMSFVFDGFDQLLSQSDSGVNRASFIYDARGRVINRNITPSGESTTWTYDTAVNGRGQLARVQRGGAFGFSESYEYDTLGQLSRVSSSMATQFMGTIGSSMQYTHGINGRLSQIIYPTVANDQFAVEYRYDGSGYLTELREVATQGILWRGLDYTARGQVSRFLLGNSIQTVQEYSSTQGYLERIYTTLGSTTVQDLRYVHDLRDSLVYREDTRQNLNETFDYDGLNRLRWTTLRRGSRIISIQESRYNDIGSITYRSERGNYDYRSGQPHQIERISGGAVNNSYSYNSNGERSADLSYQYTWNWLSKPIDIRQNTSGYPSVYFGYDAGVNAIQRRTLNQGSDELLISPSMYVDARYDGSNLDESWRYVYALGRRIAARRISGAAPYMEYYHYDNLGSLSEITSNTGVVRERLSYDPWGLRRNSDWTEATSSISSSAPFGFSSHYHLDQLNLIEMPARIYDPVIGRFLSSDPTMPDSSNPGNLNRYSYVLNRPLSLLDPTGLDPSSNEETWVPDADGMGGWSYFEDGSAIHSDFNTVEISADRSSGFSSYDTPMYNPEFMNTLSVVQPVGSQVQRGINDPSTVLGGFSGGFAEPVQPLSLYQYSTNSVLSPQAQRFLSATGDALSVLQVFTWGITPLFPPLILVDEALGSISVGLSAVNVTFDNGSYGDLYGIGTSMRAGRPGPRRMIGDFFAGKLLGDAPIKIDNYGDKPLWWNVSTQRDATRVVKPWMQ